MAERPNAVLVALGWLLAMLGGLWTVLAGGCTLVFAVSGIAPAFNGGGGGGAAAGMLPLVLVFGVVGVVPGVLILWGGLAVLRSQRRAPEAD